MFYWKYSSNRIFFLNEYWIFIPSAILANYVIIRKIRLDRARIKELERLKKLLDRERQIRRILLVSLGLNASIHLFTRGGAADFIDTDYIKELCEIEEGVHYLDDTRLRNIIHDLYKHKRKGKMIYITATAVCHLANRYGLTFFALPFAIGDFGLTNVYQTARKGFVTILLGGVGPLVVFGGPVALMAAFIVGTAGLRLAFTNLDLIPTSPVDPMKDLKPRIADLPDVVVVNRRDKMIMSKGEQETQECLLADQRLFNPKCKGKPTEIPDAIDSVLPDLSYEDTVNMKDVTGLDHVEFTDKLDFGKSEGWDTCENEFPVSEKRYLRTRNKP